MLQPILYAVLFLICVLVFARSRSHRVRQAVLLVSSYALYLTWTPWFAAVLLTSTVMNFLLGEWLRRKATTLPLATGILLNLVLLAAFKYLPEFAASFHLPSLQRFSHLALPLGLSFWTFQAMSYLFDLYRGEELSPSLPEFALYMVFFPVTISGPVCRMPDMLPQFRSGQRTSWNDIGHGLRRIAIGVFMVQLGKLLGQGILAGDGINRGFDRATQWTGPDVWCLAFGYGLQLFFDFAGYSHIVIGAARAFGIALPENFGRPFQSTTPSVFWTRWHMSLSFWIRDYVFLPLATLRREVWWRNLALVISMVIFGFWHKASVLFLLWGAYHGVLLVLLRLAQQIDRHFEKRVLDQSLEGGTPARLRPLFAWAATMALINFGWILFRGNSPGQARQMLAAALSPASYSSHFLSGSLYLLVFGLAAGYAIVLWLTGMLHRYETTAHSGVFGFFARWRWYWLPPLYALALLFLLIVTLTRGVTTAQFMYGNF